MIYEVKTTLTVTLVTYLESGPWGRHVFQQARMQQSHVEIAVWTWRCCGSSGSLTPTHNRDSRQLQKKVDTRIFFVFYVSSWGPEKQVNIYRQEELNAEKKVSRPILAYIQTQTEVLFSEIKTQCIYPHFNRCWVFFTARLLSKMTKALPYSSSKPDKCVEGWAPTSVFFKQEGVVGFQGLT